MSEWYETAESYVLTGGEDYLLFTRPVVVHKQEDGWHVEEFESTFPLHYTPAQVINGLVSKYQHLEHKAAPGPLADDEMRRWKSICEVVDRDAMFRLYQRTHPIRQVLELVEEDGSRLIRPLVGTDQPIPEYLAAFFAERELGFFEADVREEDGAILGLDLIVARPDYRVASDEEIDAYLASHRQE